MERTSGTKSILQLGSRNILHSKSYVGTTVISTSILEEIEDRLNLGNACCFHVDGGDYVS
jgi:hypothetical protein